MQTIKYIFSGLFLTAVPFTTQVCSQEQKENLNVLFIAVDDLRPALGCYGDQHAKSPNIDKLAKQGVLFANHYVQAPSCAPSRTSMLTGLRPDEVRVTNHVTHFRDTRPDIITLPEAFKNNGYTTISLGKIFHYSKGYNDSQSWNKEHFLKGTKGVYLLPENKQAGQKALTSECLDVPDTSYTDGLIAEKAIEYLKKFKESGNPFFLGTGFLKPHLPFNAPKQYWDLYNRDDFADFKNTERPENAPEITFHNWEELRGYRDIPGTGPIDQAKALELRHAYYACVSYIDAQIGKVLNALDELGLRENTIIILWGDHGYHLGEQNLWCKSTNFDIAARSPLIISAPGKGKPGTVCNAMVESVDIYPTIMDLFGFEMQTDHAGMSLLPLLKHPSKQLKKAAFNQFARPYKAAIGGNVPATHMGYSVRVEGWRYTSWYNYSTGAFEYPELYTIENPSGLSGNLAGSKEFAKIESELKKLVENYQSGKYTK